MEAKQEFRVLIIGGGNRGLAIATGLKKAGISYTLFERDSDHEFLNKTRDWGMLLHWGREHLMNVLPPHLQARIKETHVDPGYDGEVPTKYFDGKSGKIIDTIHTPYIARLSRKKIRNFLTIGEELNIQCGKRLRTVRIHEGIVTATFVDGTHEVGNVLVGCDGSRSRVREFLVGKEAAKPSNVGITMINFAHSGYTAEQARFLRSFHPVVQLSFTDGAGTALLTVLDVPDPAHPEGWLFQNYLSWDGPPTFEDLQDPKTRMKFYKERISQWCGLFRTAGLAVSDDAISPLDQGQQWSPIEWNNHDGMVTLAGDAAHSMLPHRGQGLNNAMQDASEVVEALISVAAGNSTLEETITGYEMEMQPRGAKEVALSRETAWALEQSHDWDAIKGLFFKIGHNKVN